MPLIRYLLLTGGVLFALICLSNWYFPQSEVVAQNQGPGIDRSIIAIKSAQKLPERINLDTSMKMPVIATATSTVGANLKPTTASLTASRNVSAAVATPVSAVAPMQEALAQVPSEPTAVKPKPKRKVAKVVRPRPQYAASPGFAPQPVYTPQPFMPFFFGLRADLSSR